MDSNHNGRRAFLCCEGCGVGHSLMSFLLFLCLALALILPLCSASDPCDDRIEIHDDWRNVLIVPGQSSDKCDDQTFKSDKWYTFSIGGEAASVPTTCIKNNMCGAKIPMRVELEGQAVPQSAGENITAALCGSFNVLGKYDCCVLRTTVNIARCADDRLIYNFPVPFDRCPVAVCAKGKNIPIPLGAISKRGEVFSVAKPESPTESTTVKESTTTPLDVTTTERQTDTTSSIILETSDITTVEKKTETRKDDTDTTTPKTVTATDSTSSSQPAQEETSGTPLAPLALMLSTTAPPESQTSDAETESTTAPSESQTSDSKTENTTALVTSADGVDKKSQVDNATKEVSSDSDNSTQYTPDTTVYIPFKPNADEMSTSQDSLTDRTKSDLIILTALTTATESEQTDASSQKTTYKTETTTRSETETTTKDSLETLHSTNQPSSTESTSDNLIINDKVTETTTNTDTSSASSLKDISESSSTPVSVMEHTSTSESKTPREKPVEKSTTVTSATKAATSARQSTAAAADFPTSDIDFEGEDSVITENIRLVFEGGIQKNDKSANTSEIFKLLFTFIKKAQKDVKTPDGSDWKFKITSNSVLQDFENRKMFIDFIIIQTSKQEMSSIFDRLGLKEYVTENSDLVLRDYCWKKQQCQYDSYEGKPLPSMFQKNAPAIITVIVLCCVCLLILLLALAYIRFSKRGSWKAKPEADRNVLPDNRHYFQENQSPFTDEQIMKDEMVDNTSHSGSGSAKDGDASNGCTWVIPLDQDANAKATVSIATEDTKF